MEQNAYYPFGSRHTFGNTYAQTTNRFKYNGKEEQTTGNLQYLDYGARMYDSKIARWFVQDPLSEKYYAHSPYNYCVNNPVVFVDPDGARVWPVKQKFKGASRYHLNNYGNNRPNNRKHKGVDINFNFQDGNDDLGAPVLSTHDGVVTRIVDISNGDKDAGGNRVKITSVNGEVSTYYMHLDAIVSDLQLGDYVTEGQQIGMMGGSGNGNKNSYTVHLHYEIMINGENINPAENSKSLVNPQIFIAEIDGGTLPSIIVITERAKLPPLPNVEIQTKKDKL